MRINFISSKDSDEIRTIRRKSNNIEIIMDNETDGNIEELFEFLLQKQVFITYKRLKNSKSNDKSVALNVLYVPYNVEKIMHAYKSKYKKECENQVTF